MLALACTLTAIPSCKKDEMKRPSKVSKLTPEEHYSKLDAIAAEALSYVNATDYTATIGAVQSIWTVH